MEAALNGPTGRITLGPTPLTIGRIADNQLVLEDTKASSHHAQVQQAGQGYSVTDLSSTNGTFVNEQQLDRQVPRMLNAGDVVRIGDTTFTYEVTGVAAFAPTVYVDPVQGGGQGYQPTVAAPPPTSYNQAAQPPPPPPVYPSYSQAGQPGYPPPPPQQPYAAPGYVPPVMPGYPVSSPAQPKNRRQLWIILGIVGAGVLLLCIACSVIYVAVRSTPDKTLTTYCNALKNRDYPTAYDQLSTDIKRQLTESQFAATFGNFNVTSCSVSGTNDDGHTGTGSVTYILATGQTTIGDYTLVNESDGWRISQQKFRQ